MPRAFIGSRGHRKPNGVSRLFFQLPVPSHILSVFPALISKPERFLKLFRSTSSSDTESKDIYFSPRLWCPCFLAERACWIDRFTSILECPDRKKTQSTAQVYNLTSDRFWLNLAIAKNSQLTRWFLLQIDEDSAIYILDVLFGWVYDIISHLICIF